MWSFIPFFLEYHNFIFLRVQKEMWEMLVNPVGMDLMAELVSLEWKYIRNMYPSILNYILSHFRHAVKLVHCM